MKTEILLKKKTTIELSLFMMRSFILGKMLNCSHNTYMQWTPRKYVFVTSQ